MRFLEGFNVCLTLLKTHSTDIDDGLALNTALAIVTITEDCKSQIALDFVYNKIRLKPLIKSSFSRICIAFL